VNAKTTKPLPDDPDRFKCPFCGGKGHNNKIWYGMGYTHQIHCWNCNRWGERFRDDYEAAWESFCAAAIDAAGGEK
jgi:transcription elongation factor Elf1